MDFNKIALKGRKPTAKAVRPGKTIHHRLALKGRQQVPQLAEPRNSANDLTPSRFMSEANSWHATGIISGPP